MVSILNPTSRKKDLVVQDIDSELLIYDLKTNKVYCLNETSAMVWNLCDGEKSAHDIGQSMSIKLKQTVTEGFVWLALEGLNEENLLENKRETAKHFTNVSRREAIRRVALASFVALPMISSIVAPKAVVAQSFVSTCPVGVAGGFGDTCRCSFGTGLGNTCGTGDTSSGVCQVGCVCTSDGTVPVGGNFESAACS